MHFLKSISNELEYRFFLQNNKTLFDELSIPPNKSITDLLANYHDGNQDIIWDLQNNAKQYNQRNYLLLSKTYLIQSNISNEDKILLLNQLSNLIVEKKDDKKVISVLDLTGFTHSRSLSICYNIKKISKSLYTEDDAEFPKNGIKFKTIDDFNANIHYIERHSALVSSIEHQVWDDKYILGNSGNSHHITAIYRQCKEQKLNYFFNLPVVIQSLNKNVIQEICEKYYVIIKFEPPQEFSRQTKKEESPKDLDTMLNPLNVKIKYISIPIPDYHFNFYFFPKSKTSKHIYNQLIQYNEHIFDYSKVLMELSV